MSKLAGRVALVTGAARGIGRAIAEQLAEDGASITLADIDGVAGEDAARRIRRDGGQACFVLTDISQEAAVSEAVKHTKSAFGGLDILVNNAGLNLSYNATEMTSEQWDSGMAVDLKGAWLCCKYALPEMVARGGGVIINIASVHATLTTYNMFPYGAAKAGLVGMTKSLALDWGSKNVRVIAVSPGWVMSDSVTRNFKLQADPQAAEDKVRASLPLGRIGQPADIGHLVKFLASDEASYITGTEIVIDGGISARFAE